MSRFSNYTRDQLTHTIQDIKSALKHAVDLEDISGINKYTEQLEEAILVRNRKNQSSLLEAR